MLNINIEEFLQKRIFRGDLRGCGDILAELLNPDGTTHSMEQLRELIAFLEKNNVKKIDGKKIIFNTVDGLVLGKINASVISNAPMMHVRDVRAKNGIPRYSVYKSMISKHEYWKYSYEFMGVKKDFLVSAPGPDQTESGVIRSNIIRDFRTREFMAHVIDEMQKIADGRADKMGDAQAKMVVGLTSSGGRNPGGIKPGMQYDYRQAMCAADAIVRADIGSPDWKKLDTISGKRYVYWEGFVVPGMEIKNEHFLYQCAPECWFCPTSSWKNCPVRGDRHETDGNITISDIMEKYNAQYKLLQNRANGIGDVISGCIESVSSEYQILAKTFEVTSPQSATSGNNIITGIHIPASMSDALESFSISSYFYNGYHREKAAETWERKLGNIPTLDEKIRNLPQFKKLLAANPKNNVKFDGAYQIFNLKISGISAPVSIHAYEIRGYVPKVGDTVNIVSYPSENPLDKTIKLLKLESDTEAVFTKTRALEESQTKFKNFAHHYQENEEKFRKHLLESSGRTERQILNQHYKGPKGS